jgi:hypothetical protein
MVKVKSGGGLTSNKLVQSTKRKQEPVANKASPAGASQRGMATQFRKEPLIQQGKGYNPPGVPATGVPGKYNSATQGPSSQRTVYRFGSQSTYGKVNPGEPKPAPRDILSQYGPEATGKR